MKTAKWIAAAMLCAASVTAFAQTTQVKTLKIGAAVYGQRNEFAQLWVHAVKDHPAVKNGLVKLTVFDGRYDHIAQDGQFDTMITQKFDGALYIPIDSVAAGNVVRKSVAAGLAVVGSNGPVKSDQLLSYIGSDDVLGGQIEATAVVRQLGGKGNVVILDGPVGQMGAALRGEGIDSVLKQNPDIKVLERKTANWSRAEALTLMQNWITAHPGKIHGVIAANDEMALGAIAALKAANIDPRTIPIAGIDGVTDALRAIARGEMLLTVRQDARAQAQGALDILLRHKLGPTYQPQSEIWQQYAEVMPWGGGTAGLYTVPWTEVTQENAAQFQRSR
jgi:ribose transport system substrate-binding protein/putative xylitol transport system substrate-binding protein